MAIYRIEDFDDVASFEKRFWGKVAVTSNPDECWLWLGGPRKDLAPYGFAHAKVKGRGSTFGAHRAAYILGNGPIVDGLYVLHRCDEPRCVNPSHLFLGTTDDNMADMVSKGRQMRGDQHYARTNPEKLARGDRHPMHLRPEVIVRGDDMWSHRHPEWCARGERHGWHTHPESLRRGSQCSQARVTEDDVVEIRRRFACGETTYDLGAAFGITQSATFNIVKGKTWKHVPMDNSVPVVRMSKTQKLTQQDKEDIKRKRAAGVSLNDLAVEYNICASRISVVSRL